MDMSINISSDSSIPIEEHFRVSAGPGAGKTHWLTKHIKNVIHKSDRLGKSRKIACITYTNVAVEIILNRLHDTSDQVEVSTIHSFLYKHIIKPYISFIAEEYGINITEIDGHDDHVVSQSYLRKWIENHPEKHKLKHPYTEKQLTNLDNNRIAVSRFLSTLSYYFNEDGNLELIGDNSEAFYNDDTNKRHYLSKACLGIIDKGLIEYKKLYWQMGTLHHDDILFFSYKLIQKYPFILQVLRSKFPYFYIDEFQDTNPIQTSILNQIGQYQTVVGIIGDQAQSIYGFQGAKPEQFKSFSLKNIKDYIMADNRRSTNQIIDCLNSIRTDIQQIKINNRIGEKPTIIIGNMVSALNKAIEISNNEPIYSLTRSNVTSNALKNEVDNYIPSTNLLHKLYDIDSNSERKRLVIACIKTIELSRQNQYKDAIKELERFFHNKVDNPKKDALKHIILLLENYNNFSNKKLIILHSLIRTSIDQSISDLKKGAIKDFYESYTYDELAVRVNTSEGSSVYRTIHKAKGAEFDKILVVIKDEKDLNFLLNPGLASIEEHRVYYVALSRAKEQLFITVPLLKDASKNKLSKLYNIVQL